MISRKHPFLSSCGFSMVEVIVSAILFAAAAAGIFATISMTSRSQVTDDRTTAAFLAKRLLDGLGKDVAANTWDTGELSVGTHPVTLAEPEFAAFNVSYTVEEEATGERKVQVTVEY